jgi:hypothetical protein
MLALMFTGFLFFAANDEAAKLVEQLGNASFEKREAASAELAKLKEKAKPALEAGLKSADKETRQRCKKLLDSLGKSAAGERFERFRQDPTSEPDYPLWKEFVALYGDKFHAQFCLMAARHIEQMEELAKSHAKRFDLLQAASVQVQGGVEYPYFDHRRKAKIDTWEYLFVYFLTLHDLETNEKLRKDEKISRQLYDIHYVPSGGFASSHYDKELFQPVFQAMVEKVVNTKSNAVNSFGLKYFKYSTYVTCCKSGRADYEKLIMEGYSKIPLGTKKLGEENDVEKESCFVYFGLIRNGKYLDLLHQHFSSTDVIFGPLIKNKMNLELRDIALYSALQIHSLSTTAFGFDEKCIIGINDFRMVWFNSEKDREKGFSAYADYLYR